MTIRIDQLHKKFGPIQALGGITLSVEPGETFGLIGPDGAGKTTLMRILCGLMRADAGGFSVLGYDGRREMRRIKSSIGYMPQRFSLYPDLTVDENLRFFADIFGVVGRERAERRERLLKFSRLGPFSRRRAAALSGGMKQKLALSCALIHTPRLLILDEPTTGVDPVSRREFWAILSELSGKDKTSILISTPYMDEAARCNRIAFMSQGRILAQGTPGELTKLVPWRIFEFTIESLPEELHMFDSLPGVRSARVLGDRVRLAVLEYRPDELSRTIESLGFPGLSLTESKPSLEDVFVMLLEKETAHA